MNISQRTWLEKLENVLNDYDALNVSHGGHGGNNKIY